VPFAHAQAATRHPSSVLLELSATLMVQCPTS